MNKNPLQHLMMLALVVLFAVSPTVEAKKKVHTIGDSTMANYATDGSTDKRGWGQTLQQFFNSDNVTVNNRGKSGASSKSFYTEKAYWQTMVSGGSDEMKSGDYLLIQFAHNDEKTNGADGDVVKLYYTNKGDATTATSTDYRGTTASGTFKTYMRKYIDEAKAMGVTPIVVGPICRKYFTSDGKDITRTGRHDLGDSFTLCDGTTLITGNKVAQSDHTHDYAAQAKAVAEEYADVPYIDLTTATANLYKSYGDAYCTANLFCSGDKTHPQLLGATLIARTFAQLLVNQAQAETDAAKKAVLAGLASDVVIGNEVTFNPISGDLGEGYVGMSLTKEYGVSAFGLATESGNMTFTASEGFRISVDKTNWQTTLTVPYTGSSLISTIYVRADIAKVGRLTGTLTVADGTDAKTLDLSVTGKSLAGGEATTCVWRLASASGVATSPVLAAADVATSQMTKKGIVTPENAPENTMTYFEVEGGNWPAGEIDEVSTRYIEFRATVPADKVFNISNVSFNVAGWGGNTVSYHAYCATRADFSDQTLLAEGIGLRAKQMNAVNADVVRELHEGESLYLRVYPWLNGLASAATGKYICLSDVTISGTIANEGAQTVTVNGSITYPFNTVAPRDYTLSDPAMAVGIANVSQTLGSQLTDAGTRSYTGGNAQGKVFAKINAGAGGSGSSATDANAVKFTIIPADGFTFVPTGLSFHAARAGTNAGSVACTAVCGDASVEVTDAAYVLNTDKKTDALNTFSGEISGLAATVDSPLTLNIHALGFGVGKTLMLSDVTISGTLTGAPTATVKHTLATSVLPAEGGTVTVDPNMASYRDGATVTLKAVPAFGYAFSEWQEQGATISDEAETTVSMTADRSVTAVFTPVNVYTVTTKVTNNLDKSLGSVTLTPAGNGGRYEEGTEITATANESRILKFAGWTDAFENNDVTTAVRTLHVNGDMKLVANYEVQDFIAVFDASSVQGYAYADRGGYPYSADLVWDDNRSAQSCIVKVADGTKVYSDASGTPVVRNRTGAVLSTINGLYQNGYRTSDIAWQYQFSTRNFTSANFLADMSAKNMADKSYKAMYSVDGTTYTDITTWDVTPNVVKPLAFELPADAMDRDMVYVRITGTGGEQLSTAYSVVGQFDGLDYYAHSECSVGNVYITGEAVAVDDGRVPAVVSTMPAADATGVSASGTVTISYSERIQPTATNAKVTISDGKAVKEVAPAFSSMSISFPYANLAYGTAYTVSVPAGFVQDKAGNDAEAYVFTFTVMNRKKPASRTYDAIVDGSLTMLDMKKAEYVEATESMPRQYRTLQNAIDAAPSDGTKPYLIYVRNGYYRDPNFTFNASYGQHFSAPDDASSVETEKISGGINEYDSCRIVYIDKPNVHIIGQSRDNVIIATDRLDGSVMTDRSKAWYHINAGAAVEVMERGTDFHMENLTVDNENWTKKRMAGPQALCFNISGDRAVLNNVRTRSYQDTYYNGGTYNRTFWNNSEIHGAVDFIYGSGDVWFEDCTLDINRSSGGFIVAPSHPLETRWGYVFNNTRITTSQTSDPSSYSIWLGRPWQNYPKTVFLHTQMELTPCDSLWYQEMGGKPDVWAVYDFHDANGYSFTGAKNISRTTYYFKDESRWATAKSMLTAEETAQYTVENVMAGDGSSSPSGYWNPRAVIEKTAKPVVAVNGNVATWTADPFAICYVVIADGKAVAFPTDCRYVGSEGEVITVQSVNEYGSLSETSDAVTLSGADGVIGVVAPEAGRNAASGRFLLDGRQIQTPPAHGTFIENGRKLLVR